MQPGVTYRLFQHAPAARAGTSCRFIDDSDPYAFLGGTNESRGGFRNPPARVSHDGRTYVYTQNVVSEQPRQATLSCSGGPLLAEPARVSLPAVLGFVAMVGTALVSAAVVALLRRRSPRVPRDNVTQRTPVPDAPRVWAIVGAALAVSVCILVTVAHNAYIGSAGVYWFLTLVATLPTVMPGLTEFRRASVMSGLVLLACVVAAFGWFFLLFPAGICVFLAGLIAQPVEPGRAAVADVSEPDRAD
ncbi:hypothetical protein [Goodfellowiella coeruleoviolacea]|nr:hypothetical protein [Goodfellowiella coeruleoviolacea]